MKQPLYNPIIQRNPGDRTGTSGLQKSTIAEIGRRVDVLEKEVLALFDAVQYLTLNADYLYSMTLQQQMEFNDAISEAVTQSYGLDKGPQEWWYGEVVLAAATKGAAQTAANLANMSPIYAGDRAIEDIVNSQPFLDRVAKARLKSYEHWTNLGATAKNTLAQTVMQSIALGENPKIARKRIQERLSVSKSDAARYAQTDITDTLRQAKMAESQEASEKYGLKLGQLWASALLPTTRHTHAVRHGRVYTIDEVQAFYSKDGNRYNCHCSVTEILLDDAGEPLLAEKTKERMSDDRKAWRDSVDMGPQQE